MTAETVVMLRNWAEQNPAAGLLTVNSLGIRLSSRYTACDVYRRTRPRRFECEFAPLNWMLERDSVHVEYSDVFFLSLEDALNYAVATCLKLDETY
jgi:hypothetical protein